MIELKPRCAGCGTGNAIDAVFCIECGIKFTREEINDNELEFHGDGRGFYTGKNDEFVRYENEEGIVHILKRDKNGKLRTPDNELFELDTNERKACSHMNTIQKIQCECVSCLSCDKRLETCLKHVLKFDYGIQTKKKNSLDHLRDDKGKFVVKDKRLDFRSMQIPDWEFGKTKQVKETFKKDFEKWKNNPYYIPLSPITGTDVRKGVPPQKPKQNLDTRFKWGVSGKDASRKRPKKQNPKEYITIKKNYNSKILWLFPITIWSIFIYFSLFY